MKLRMVQVGHFGSSTFLTSTVIIIHHIKEKHHQAPSSQKAQWHHDEKRTFHMALHTGKHEESNIKVGRENKSYPDNTIVLTLVGSSFR